MKVLVGIVLFFIGAKLCMHHKDPVEIMRDSEGKRYNQDRNDFFQWLIGFGMFGGGIVLMIKGCRGE